MWEHFEDLTSCPALTRMPDSLLLFRERLTLQTVGGGRAGVGGGQGHRRTLFGIFLRLRPLERSFQGSDTFPLLSELCVRSMGLPVMPERVNEAKARTGIAGWDTAIL